MNFSNPCFPIPAIDRFPYVKTKRQRRFSRYPRCIHLLNHLLQNCRACLLQTTQLSPDGRACPLCRAPIQMEDPKTHPIDRTVENIIRENVLSSEYELRLSSARTVIKQLEERARTTLPIFYMAPGCSVGQLIALHLFEPRYRILIRRAMEGNKMFVYCSKTPKFSLRYFMVARAAFCCSRVRLTGTLFLSTFFVVSKDIGCFFPQTLASPPIVLL